MYIKAMRNEPLISQTQVWRQELSKWAPESGIKTDLSLTFASHSTLKDEKFAYRLTSVFECTFSRELRSRAQTHVLSLHSLDSLKLERKRGTGSTLSSEK